MNILQLLKPKVLTAYVVEDMTLRQAIEMLRRYGYTAVPVIDRDGKYVKALAEGDFMWFMLENRITELSGLEKYCVKDLPRRVMCEPVYIDSTIGDLFMLSMNQNFVPVVDDRGVFSGIVTRRDILQACYSALKDCEMFSAQPEYIREEAEI
jgi:CBS domain-containing protein